MTLSAPGGARLNPHMTELDQAPALTRAQRQRVAVVVPMATRPNLLPEEEISLRHLNHFLGAFDRFMVASPKLPLELPGFERVELDESYFGSLAAYERMMLSEAFYEQFTDYDYILTYHLDALVFSDRLLEWCDRGYDFLGAPNHGQSDDFSVVCNGGFALRRVRSFLGVLRSPQLAVDPAEYWRRLTAGRGPLFRLANLPRRFLKRYHRFNNVRREINLVLEGPSPHLEDVFYVHRGPWYMPGFRLPTIPEAMRFSFDESPRKAFERNGRQLPFGCHGWYKQDREFWEPYLLT